MARLSVVVIDRIVVGMIVWAYSPATSREPCPRVENGPPIAANTLALPMWEGGLRMMRAGDEQAFGKVTAADRPVIAGRSELAGCAKRADWSAKPFQCLIVVEPARRSGR